MIRIVGHVAGYSAHVQSDTYIPLAIKWLPDRGQNALPLYLMVSGPENAYVELNLDVSTGALIKLVVLGDLPSLATIAPMPKGPDDVLGSTATIDRDRWPGVPREEDWLEFRPVDVQIDGLAMYRDEDRTVVRFGTRPVTRRIECRGAVIGVSSSEELMAVEVSGNPTVWSQSDNS